MPDPVYDSGKIQFVDARLKSQSLRIANIEKRILEVTVQKSAPGVKGDAGAKGMPGLEGPLGPMPRHEWRGTELRFQQGPDGAWGAFVDLKGPAGEIGYGVGVIETASNGYFPSGW